MYRDELAHRAAVLKLDNPGDLGKEGVVFAAAYVEAGFNPGTALPHDDGATRYQLTAERLNAEPLRVGVAAVSGAA